MFRADWRTFGFVVSKWGLQACSLLRYVMREFNYDSNAMKSREKSMVDAKADVMKKYVRAAFFPSSFFVGPASGHICPRPPPAR